MLQMTRLHALNSDAESEIPDGAESSVHVRDVFEWDPTTAAFAPIPAEERTTQVSLQHPPHPQLTNPGRRRRRRTQQFRTTHQTQTLPGEMAQGSTNRGTLVAKLVANLEFEGGGW